MKFLLLFFILIYSCTCSIAQNNLQSQWENRCEFLTDGNGKALGVKLKIKYPCSWTSANGERPHIVKKFSFDQSGTAVVPSLAIRKLPTLPGKSEIDEFLSPGGLRELGKDLGTYISGRRVKIDGLDCGEIIFKSKREHPVTTLFMYNIQYYIIYRDKLIVLSYAVGSDSEDKSLNIFTVYKPLFHGLAGNMVIISRWEE